MQSLQVELIDRLGGNEFHRRALYGLGNRLGVAEIIFLPFAVGAHLFRGHQPRIVTVDLQPAAQVVRAHTGLHSDQAGRHCGEAALLLVKRDFLDTSPGD
jgi:hypothetical protein